MTPEGLLAYHEKEPRGTHCGGPGKCSYCGSEEANRRALAHAAGHVGEGEGQCGGYYKCPAFAAEISRLKAAEFAGPRHRARPLTDEERAHDRARLERRRAKAKAARKARKL